MWDLIVSVPDHCLSFLLLIICIIIFVYAESGRVLKGDAQEMEEFARPG